MRLDLRLSAIRLPPNVATVVECYVRAGDDIRPGSRILDLRVDFSGGVPLECPPVAYYRLIAREPGRVVRIAPVVSASLSVDATLAVFEAIDRTETNTASIRPIRFDTIGFIHQEIW